MTLWLVFALMTAATIFVVLWPLGRRKPLRPGSDVAVYRDQLDEIQRDRSAGLIGEAEAEAARVEVSRRLIAAADAAESEKPALETSSLWRRRATAIAGLVLLPVGTVALYLTLGSPDLPGAALASRAQTPSEAGKVENMIAQVEDHLARNPKDGRAWEVLAPVYMRLGRFNDAVRAWSNAIALNGSNAERESEYGQALVAAANGVVTADAEADKIWGDLLAKAPPADHDVNAMVERLANRLKKDGSDAQGWVQLVRTYRALGQFDKAQAAVADARRALAGDADGLRQFAEGSEGAAPTAPTAPAAPPMAPAAGAPGPSAADIAAAEQMKPDEQNQMIRSMVARLADKLKQDGSDVAGWERLLRAYMVLGDHDKAQAAAAEARRALAGDPDKLRRLDAAIKDLKVEG